MKKLNRVYFAVRELSPDLATGGYVIHLSDFYDVRDAQEICCQCEHKTDDGKCSLGKHVYASCLQASQYNANVWVRPTFLAVPIKRVHRIELALGGKPDCHYRTVWRCQFCGHFNGITKLRCVCGNILKLMRAK